MTGTKSTKVKQKENYWVPYLENIGVGLASGINGSRNPKGFSPPSLLSTPSFYLVCLTLPILYLLAVFLSVVLIFLTTDKLSPNNKEDSCQEPWMKSLSVSSVTKRKALVPLTPNGKISEKDSDWSILGHKPRWLGCGERLNLGHSPSVTLCFRREIIQPQRLSK